MHEVSGSAFLLSLSLEDFQLESSKDRVKMASVTRRGVECGDATVAVDPRRTLH